MARIRSVHPDICTSETMADLEARYERTFVRLWTHCDDHGRCVDNARLIKAGIYPLHDKVTAEILEQDLVKLAELELIVRYAVGAKRYIEVASWGEFQHPRHPSASKCPDPPEPYGNPPQHDGGCAGTAPEAYGETSQGVGEGEGVGEGVIAPPQAGREVAVLPAVDPVWNALLSVCSIHGEITKQARGAYNSATKALRDVGATPDEIHIRAVVFRTRWPAASLTPTALARRWPECEPDPNHLPAPKVNGNRATLARLAASENHATA